MPLTAGTRLGPYEIVAPIGAGGMGEVYKASDTRLGRDVAIKVLPADVARDPERLARFEREARAVSALNHPNIVTLYEVGTSDAGPYLVLENIEGRSLRDVIAEDALPIRRILTLAAQIAEGVAKAHAAGIVHRDLKPDNVMITADGFAKVLDFGLAKLVFPELGAAPIAETTMAKDTASGVVLGTLGYLSPEQASGKPADFRADQFALGALMYEMATRERPFKRATVLESLTATIRDEPEPVRSKRPDLPAPFEWVIERCLSKDPNDRYASTSDLARDLASMRDRLSDLMRMPAGDAPGRARSIPRRLLGWTLAAAVVAAVAAGAFTWGRRTAPVSVPSFRPLTFERGLITGARFGSDGKTVFYSMSQGAGPSYVYVTRTDRIETRRLEIPPGFLLSVSSRDELGVLLTSDRATYVSPGTYVRVPAIGGTPRPLVDGVTYADWSADGEHLAIQRGGCEFPVGRPIKGGCSLPRVSPDGGSVAFVRTSRDRDASSGFVSRLMVQSGDGEPTAITVMPFMFGHAWSRDGREVWFSGSETGNSQDRALYAVPLAGGPRLIARAPGAITVLDVAPDNKSALIITGAGWLGINARIDDARDERSLDHAGRADIVGITADGTHVLLNETRDVARGAVLKTTDGAQTVPLDPGIGHGLSPDGAWAVVLSRENPPRIKLVSTGAAGVRDLPLEGALEPVLSDYARWSGDSRRMFILLLTEKNSLRSTRVHLLEEKGSWRAVTPAGLPGPFVVSPRGDIIAMNNDAGVVTLYYVDGRPPTTLTGETGTPVHWSADGRELLLSGPERLPGRVYRRDIATGRVQPWRTIAPADPTGVLFIGRVLVAADNRSYVYQYNRGLNDLYLAYNLR
jgi:hypothetical protein